MKTSLEPGWESVTADISGPSFIFLPSLRTDTPTTLWRHLVAENRRRTKSRSAVCNTIFRRHLTKDTVVVDFGCGSGRLSRAAAPYCRQVVGVDVSRGVLACARALNRETNIRYLLHKRNRLARAFTSSVELIYSFAVFQHLNVDQLGITLRLFHRMLKPGGISICRLAKDTLQLPPQGRNEALERLPFLGNRIRGRNRLFVEFHAPETFTTALTEAGFASIDKMNISQICNIEDHIGQELLYTCSKGGGM